MKRHRLEQDKMSMASGWTGRVPGSGSFPGTATTCGWGALECSGRMKQVPHVGRRLAGQGDSRREFRARSEHHERIERREGMEGRNTGGTGSTGVALRERTELGHRGLVTRIPGSASLRSCR